MFDHRHYVPILLTRRGERRALADVPPEVKERFTPLFTVAPVAWDYESEQPAKSLDAHLAGHAQEIAQCWGQQIAFVDLMHLDPAARLADGRHALTALLDDARRAGLPLVPVVTPTSDAAYRQASAAAARQDGLGSCVRLFPDQWPSNAPANQLPTLLSDVGVDPSTVDLVLDLADAANGNIGLVTAALRNELDTLPFKGQWRSITVAGGSFPPSLGGIPRGETLIERQEWAMYTRLVTSGDVPEPIPTFGDYAVAHPDPVVDVDPRIMSISAALRYTTPEDWLVAKGELFKGSGGTGQGGAAMVPVARAVAASPHFRDRDYSAGDHWIADTADGRGGGGNPETWRRVATCHHLHVVAEQVANLHGA